MIDSAMTSQLLALVVGQVKLGVPLPFGVRAANGMLLLAAGYVISTERQLDALLARGIYADRADIEAYIASQAQPAVAKKLSIFDVWEQTVWRLDKLLKGVDQEPGFTARCDDMVSHLMALVQRDIDIGIYLSVRQDERRLKVYGLTHALHCALVCQLMVTRMGWPPARVRTLLKAALTMNLSIVDVQGTFATSGRLSDVHRAQIRAHPEEAVALLQAAGVTDPVWLKAVLQHHEHPGGGGYPHDVKELSEEAAVLRMADVFMAKISPRTDRPALPVQAAARQLFSESGGSQAAAALVKEYGIYPPGNFVQLASGEVAVVIRRSAAAHTPLAAAISDRNGQPTIHTTQRDTAQPAYAIKALLPDNPKLLRIAAERLYGLVA